MVAAPDVLYRVAIGHHISLELPSIAQLVLKQKLVCAGRPPLILL